MNDKNSKTPLLLHTISAYSLPYPLKTFQKQFDVLIFFYSPFIHPEDEYIARCREAQSLAQSNDIEFLFGRRDLKRWCKLTNTNETQTTPSQRCARCFSMVFETVFRKAQAMNISNVASTLPITNESQVVQMNNLACRLAQKRGVTFHARNFHEDGCIEKNHRMAQDLELRPDNYCGCVFSRIEKINQEIYNRTGWRIPR